MELIVLFDVFFSISRTPAHGTFPSEAEMFHNFFHQLEAADYLGYKTAWVAEAHLSSEIQKSNTKPVIPHWKGEIGLMTDFFQTAHMAFARTKRIEFGSAILNILCNGGPIAAAERVAALCTLHGINAEKRRIHLGFAGGRFEFMNSPYGIFPRNEVEQAAWPALKGQIFSEAAEIFCRLLRGDVIASSDISSTVLSRSNFRSDSDWKDVQQAAGGSYEQIEIPNRYVFEALKIIPENWQRDLLRLIVGSHDPQIHVKLNQILPVQVFNLSITQRSTIEATHNYMKKTYHPQGGSWKREYMPRTIFVFINGQSHLSSKQQSDKAKEEAMEALKAYWSALEGTIDPVKITNAANNALIGNPQEIGHQIQKHFHPNDRLMLWFDFFNHDTNRVIENMTVFMKEVVPLLSGKQNEASFC